jgi:hypothetical protein
MRKIMKPYYLSLLGSLLSVGLFSGSASANPVNCEIFRAAQQPSSTHVQINFVNNCNENATLVSLTRDGTKLNTDWRSYTDFIANMGSGVDTAPAKQFCDCDVSVGSHTYTLAYRIKSEGDTYNGTFDETLNVLSVDELNASLSDSDTADVIDSSDTDSEVMPWDEPEPQGIQGLDCAEACASGEPGTEAGAIAAANEKNSGCSIIAAGEPLNPTPILFVLLGLIPIWLLKRKTERD